MVSNSPAPRIDDSPSTDTPTSPQNPIEGYSEIPPDVMVLIRRVAKYLSRVHEGLLRESGDLPRAIFFARASPDGMTEEEHEQAIKRIAENSDWGELVDRLTQAASDEIELAYFGHRFQDE